MIELKTILILFSVVLVFLGSLLWISKNYYKEKKIARLYSCQQESRSDLKIKASTENKRIVLFGDSRIQDWGEPYFGKNIDVINIGIGGGTTGEALCRLDDTILNIKPEWFIIQLGINDLVAASMMSKNLRLKAETKTLYNLKRIVGKLASTSSRVLVLTLVAPISPDILRRLIWGEGIAEAAERLSDALIAELPNTVEVYDMKKIFFDYNTNAWKTKYSINALHWNKEAYNALTMEIEKIISK